MWKNANVCKQTKSVGETEVLQANTKLLGETEFFKANVKFLREMQRLGKSKDLASESIVSLGKAEILQAKAKFF